MSFKVATSSTTDKSLTHGIECEPHVAAVVDGSVLVRSHGDKSKVAIPIIKQAIVENAEPEFSTLPEPSRSHLELSIMPPSGDTSVLATGFNMEKPFKLPQALTLLRNSTNQMREDTQALEGSATFAAVIVAEDGVVATTGGDGLVCFAAKVNGTWVVKQFSEEQIAIHHHETAKKDITSPVNCIGQHLGKYTAQDVYKSISNEDIRKLFGEGSEVHIDEEIIVFSCTDGPTDKLHKFQPKYSKDFDEYEKNLTEVLDLRQASHEQFFSKVFNKLEAAGTPPSDPDFGKNFVKCCRSRNNSKEPSEDDIGATFSRINSTSAKTMVFQANIDAVGSTDFAGIEVSRKAGQSYIASLTEFAGAEPEISSNTKFHDKDNYLPQVRGSLVGINGVEQEIEKITVEILYPIFDNKLDRDIVKNHLLRALNKATNGKGDVIDTTELPPEQQPKYAKILIYLDMEDAGLVPDIKAAFASVITTHQKALEKFEYDPTINTVMKSDALSARLDPEAAQDFREHLPAVIKK